LYKVFKKSNAFYKQHESRISKLGLMLKERVKRLGPQCKSVELIEDFSDECLNIFKIVLLIQKSKKELRKVGVIFYDRQTLHSPFEKMKLMIEVLLLRNFFKWELVLINQGSEYELQKTAELIMEIVREGAPDKGL